MREVISRSEAARNGASYYFTGKPCGRGHVDMRRVDNYACVLCAKAASKRFASTEEGKSSARLATQRWRERNPEKVAQYSQAQWSRPEVREYREKWYQENRDAVLSARRITSLTEDERLAENAKNREKYRRNPRKKLDQNRNCRIARRGAEGKFSQPDIERILKSQCHKCAGCQTSLSAGYHVDHIIPLSKGGTNWPRNLQCLCPSCNLSKGAADPIDWAQRRGNLL